MKSPSPRPPGVEHLIATHISTTIRHPCSRSLELEIVITTATEATRIILVAKSMLPVRMATASPTNPCLAITGIVRTNILISKFVILGKGKYKSKVHLAEERFDLHHSFADSDTWNQLAYLLVVTGLATHSSTRTKAQ